MENSQGMMSQRVLKSLWDGMSKFLWGKWTLNMLGLNVTMGKNVTVWEEGHHEVGRKNVTEWMFCHNQEKKGGCFVKATLRPPPGLGGCKFPGRFVWRRYVTVDIVNTLRWVDIPWVSKRY